MKAVYVHGGVSGREKDVPSLAFALSEALEAHTALDAVEAAVMALEDDPRLNAGYGSVLDRKGVLEMDAGIMDGRTGRAGGVANVGVRHPISLARRVLEETPHVLITGRGATELAVGMETLTSTTEQQVERFEDARADGTLDIYDYGKPEHVDTVGAVALDDAGSLAAASSTGGVFGKMPGRVGDAPIVGAGVFASPRVAVIGTGVGELFLETLASHRVALLVDKGTHPQEACERVIEEIAEHARVTAGLMALDALGRFGCAYRGGSMAVNGPDGPIQARRVD